MKKMVRHGLWAPLLGAILLSAGCVTDWDPETDDDFADGADTETSSGELESQGMESEGRDTTLSNAASFFSQSVPATMVAGQKYMVSVTMRNDGATWNRDGATPHRLGSQPQDTQIWVTTRAILPQASVTTGGEAKFLFEVTAPSTPGTYDFQWRMLQEHVEWFGPVTPKVTVQVTQGVPPLYSGFYLRNWPTGDGRTQWSELFVSNPNDVSALVTIRIHKRTGGLHAVVQQTIAAHGSWNSYGQPAWLNLPFTDSNASAGWIEVGSDRPVVATQRAVIRTGNTYNSPIALLQDDVLSHEASTTLYAPFYFKNWPSGDADKTQWSDLLLVNPSSSLPATVTIKVNKVDGTGLRGTPLTASIAPGATFNTYGLSTWLNMPDASPGLGWVEVTSDRPIVGINRVTLRNGSTYNAPTAFFQDEVMSGKRATRLGSSQFLKGWTHNGLGEESPNLILVNPGASAATARVSIYKHDGSVLASFDRTVPARGWWNSYQDTSWDNVPSARGWIDVTVLAPPSSPSPPPIFGNIRKSVFSTNHLQSLDDALLTSPLLSPGYAAPYVKNWPSGDGFSTQWSDVVVSNPQPSVTTFTLNVYPEGGGTPVATFQKSIPANGFWDSSTDTQWLNTPASLGWIELIPSQSVRATHRLSRRSGSVIYSFHDVELVTTQP